MSATSRTVERLLELPEELIGNRKKYLKGIAEGRIHNYTASEGREARELAMLNGWEFVPDVAVPVPAPAPAPSIKPVPQPVELTGTCVAIASAGNGARRMSLTITLPATYDESCWVGKEFEVTLKGK